jgi:phosphinothricin acetyltransferase
MAVSPVIRPVTRNDAAAIAGIYNHYITNTAISFEEEPVSAGEMEKRIADISAKYPWLVWEEAGEVLGYTYVNKYRERSAYRYTAELTIYLKNGLEGRGMGSGLLARLLEELKKTGIHALVSAVTLPNERSAAIHEKFGFTKIAEFKEVGFKFGKWLHVGYWELLLK